ncbi:MAG: U32 family peptidase, partial [Lachnospiraceae bacterium]|nr:U32 family peptidase [Lachnospiraceae bacterium]
MTPAAAELLSPAGDRACFVGALSAGADAVYLAGQKFGARAYAGNFTSVELITSIREAHALHRRVYLTANILTREDELDETVDFVCEMAAHGLDGVIVQDLGVAARVHEAFPDLPIHASTQMSSTTAESVRFLKQLGVSRIVPARELSLDEIRLLKAQDIEIEAFIHGAMCYSYSGRCLFSSFLGGRSGNRGRCAGTCRLPFSVSDESGRKVMETAYPISMKDMTVLEILPELLDAGIDSFKIEGRMKRPEYAAGVTSVYRRYIDRYIAWTNSGRKEPWRIDREDINFLSHLYIRTAKSTGYYHTQNGPSLITIGKPGYAGTDDALLKEIHDRYCRALPVREIGARVFLRVGEPAGLYLYDPADPSVCAYRTG